MALRWASLRTIAKPDPFVLMILATVVVAAMLPARGVAVPVSGAAANAGIMVLFWLYGLRLAVSEAVAGVRHWRLHLTVLVVTFVVFPVLGEVVRTTVMFGVLSYPLYLGVLYLCLLPSTVQSSIGFTSSPGATSPGRSVARRCPICWG